MESDLPLIEIAGEDDSLLEQLPDLDDTHIIPNVSSSYFACSPLQLSMIKPRLSCSKGFKARMDPEKPSCSSTQSSSNKENINVNKSEVPKLSVEPLQMKKRKKGGGYNLRKSLAWDRAFDTDEGVLDPLELSMIAGAFSKSRRENLPIISEEGSDTLYAGSNCTNESEDLQAVDGTLFTELSDMSNTLKEDEEKGACLVPRHISSTQDNINSTPKVTRKVFSTYGGAKSGSKGGVCPKPLTSSSLKRPACASTVRVIRKDSKLPKLPASKTGSCLLPTHARSTTHVNSTTQYSSYLKPNQIAKPAVNIQKTVTAKFSSTNVKCAQTKAKTGPGVVASRVNDSARNLTNSLLEAQSSTNSRLLHISGVNSGSEVIPQSKVPSTRFHLREGQISSGSPAISLSLNPSIANGKVINPKIQSMKPSGLRKPSPSMRFFGQSKASGSETLMQRSVGLCDSYLGSNIDGTHKFGLSRPPPVPKKTPLTASISNKQWSSSSALCAVPDKTVKSDLGVLNVQNRETEVQSDCKSSESLCWKQNGNGNGNGNIEAKPEVCLPVDCIQLKETVLKHHSNLQIINNQVTSKGGSNKQHGGDFVTELEKFSVPFPYDDMKQENGGATGVDDFPEQSPAGNSQLALHGNLSSERCNSDSITAIEKNKYVEVCELSNQYPGCFESKCHREQENGDAILVADICKASPSEHVQEKASDGKISSNNYNSDQDIAVECTDSSEVRELSDQHAKCFESTSHREQENGGVDGVDYVSNRSPVEHAQQRTANTSRYNRGCLEVCEFSDKSVNNLEMEIVCSASEPTCQFNNEWQPDDSTLLGENSCSKEPHCEKAIDSVQFVFPETNDFRVRGSNVLSVINTKVPAQLKDDGADVDLVSEKTPMEETHVCSPEFPLLTENHAHGSHKNFMLNVSFVGEAMPSDFGTYLSTESGLLVQATQPSSEGSNVPLKVVDQLSHNVVKESQMHEEDPYNRQRIEASGGSSFQRSTAAEDSQFYLADAGDDQGCSYIMEISHRQIQTADQADKDVGKVDNVPESHLAAQIQLFNGDKLVGSCSNDTPISHEQSTKIAIPVEVLGEQPEFPDRNLKVQQVLVDNQDNLLLDSEGFCKESLLENVEDVPEDVYGCDLGTMDVITQATTAELENCHDFADDQPSLDVVPLGSPVIDSTECNEFSVDRPIIRSMESSGQAISCIDSSLKEANDHSTSLSTTFTEPSSIHEISSLTGPVQKIFGEQPEVSNPYYEIEVVRTKHNQVTLKDDISPKKIIDSEKFQLDYVAESLAEVPEGSFIYDNDPSSSNEVVQAPLTAERIELSENGQSYVADGPSLPLKSSAENHEFFTAGKISHDIEISGQASSGIEPDLNISKDQTLSLETTSEFCSLHEESCSFVGEDTNLSKSSSQLSIGVNDLKNYQDETVTTDGNCLAGELHHELDTAGDLEKDMDATLSIKSSENKMKLDVPLIKPPPNAVPFSDEWLAAIEAAGEDILTLKSGAVQNSPTDKSLPEPSPWSPVKRKNIQLGPFDCTKKLGNTLPGEPSN